MTRRSSSLSAQRDIELLKKMYMLVDGLWFRLVENKFGYAAALELDNEVWTEFAKRVATRIKKMYGIEGEDPSSIFETIEVRWKLEGWNYEVVKKSDEECIVKVLRCPWVDGLRKADRYSIIPDICSKICINLYREWTRAINPNVSFERDSEIGLGGNFCLFKWKLKRQKSDINY